MQIHVTKDGQQFGPYSLSDVQQYIASGSFSRTDLGWYEGASDWQPLSSIPGLGGGNTRTSSQASTPPPITAAIRPGESSGLAISSLVLGILSFFSLGLTSLPAVICGHLSLANIKKSAGALAGKGMAIAGLVLGYVFLGLFSIGLLAVFAGIALPVFGAVDDRSKSTRSLSNAKQIATACKLYAMDNHGNFPPNLEVLIPDYLPDRSTFVSPFAKDKTELSYEYTPNLKDTDPDDRVLLRDRYLSKKGDRVIIYVDIHGEVKHER